MHVEINDSDTGQAMSAGGMFGGERYGGIKAKAHRFITLGMVTGRAHSDES